MINPRIFRLIRLRIAKSANCRCYASSSSITPTSPKENILKIGRGRKAAVAEIVKQKDENYTDKPEYPPITAPFGRYDLQALRFEKKEFGEFVKSLPTAQEKIYTVNPYERSWNWYERKWHRDYMHPKALPRAVFRVHAIPEHYNLLPFYQFITNTHFIDGLPSDFHDQQRNIDRELEEFIPLAVELIQNEQRSYTDRQFSSTDYVCNITDQMANAACSLFASDFPHLAEAQMAQNNSVQAFWVRGGFRSLYPADDKKPTKFLEPGEVYPTLWHKEILGDDRRRQGEFAFCLRERSSVSIRNKLPLPEVLKMDDPLCRTPIPPYVYAPLTVGLLPDKTGPTEMTPGFECGDQYEFNSLQFYPIDNLMSNMMRYKGADPNECYDECLRSASMMLSFATLMGQAHFLGFTQYNDLTYPLTTQTILTDGQYWHFSVYQLNSISLESDWDEPNSPTNLIWHSGPMKLYDRAETGAVFHGLNTDVLKLLLKFMLLEPKQRPGLQMRPYLLDRSTTTEDELKAAELRAKSVTTLRDLDDTTHIYALRDHDWYIKTYKNKDRNKDE